MKQMIVYILVLSLHSLSMKASAEVGAATGVLTQSATGAATGAVQAGATQAAAGQTMSKGIGDFFNSPKGVLVISGIGAVYSGMLYKAAAEQEAEAEENIKKIDRVLLEFKDSFVAFCPNGREDLSQPDCYCYLSSGEKNQNRTKSQICQDLWTKNSYKLSAVAGDYGGLSKFADPVGCLTVSGQFDENCKCKKFLDKSGNNACQKGVSITLPQGFGTTFATNTAIKDIVQLSANAGNGNPLLGNFNTGALASKAIATQKLKEALLSKVAADLPADALKYSNINSKNVDSFANAILGEKAIAAATAGSKSALDITASSPEGKMTGALKAAATKAGLDFSGSGKGLANKKADNKEALAFNFNPGQEAQAQAGQLQDFPEQPKTYKIKGDISKQSGASLFEIISNRYIQSGLKRLFEE